MRAARSTLTLDRLRAEALTFGLASADFRSLTIRVVRNGTTVITSYPESNANAGKFFDHLVRLGLALRAD
jgi:hypothetical protein